VELGENGTGETNGSPATMLESPPFTTSRIDKYRFAVARVFRVRIPAQFSNVNLIGTSKKLLWGFFRIYAEFEFDAALCIVIIALRVAYIIASLLLLVASIRLAPYLGPYLPP
jgi:hypothetical protein